MKNITNAQNDFNYIKWLDALKGVGILLVVFGHINRDMSLFEWMHTFRMPLFFFASGWTYKTKPIFSFINKKIKTIVFPYFALGFIGLIYWYIIERKFRNPDLGFLEALFGLFIGQDDYLSFNVHIWFLPCFFITLVYFNTLSSLTSYNHAIIISLIASFFMQYFEVKVGPWGIDKMFYYLPYFIFGILSRKSLILEFEHKSEVKLFLYSFILFLINYTLFANSAISNAVLYLSGLVGVFACIFLSILIENNRFIEYCGSISLVILCFHGYLYRIIIKIFSIVTNLDIAYIRNDILFCIIITLITVFACGIIHKLLIKYIPTVIGK